MLEEALIVLSLKKALCGKPQLLEYMKVKILQDFLTNLETTTDQEVEAYLNATNTKGQV